MSHQTTEIGKGAIRAIPFKVAPLKIALFFLLWGEGVMVYKCVFWGRQLICIVGGGRLCFCVLGVNISISTGRGVTVTITSFQKRGVIYCQIWTMLFGSLPHMDIPCFLNKNCDRRIKPYSRWSLIFVIVGKGGVQCICSEGGGQGKNKIERDALPHPLAKTAARDHSTHSTDPLQT